MTKRQTKTPPAKRTAKQTKGEAKRTARPTANPATPPPAADGKGAWVLFPEWKADARGIIPPPPIPPPPEPGAKVDPWRDKAREIVHDCGWSWEALEDNERQPGRNAIAGMGIMGGAVYWALAHAVRLTPAQLDEAAGNLKRVLVAAKKDAARFCEACALFPEAVRRLAESPAATPTESPNADAVREVSARLGELEAHTARAAEAVANLAAVAEKRREGGRKGGRVSARSRGRNPEVTPALDRMGERLRAGKSQSILAAARWVSTHGSPLLKADGEELKPETLARYYKARTAKRRRRADAERG